MRSLMLHATVRVLFLGAFLTTGLFVLAGYGMAAVPGASPARPAVQTAALPAARTGLGLGAGDTAAVPAGCGVTDIPGCAVTAFNAVLAPVVGTLSSFSASVLTNLARTLQAPADNNSFSFLVQTPLCFAALLPGSCTTQDPLDATLGKFVTWAQGVAAAALSFILIIGGLNLLLGRQMGMRVQDLSELIPRVVVVSLSAFAAPLIVQAFIALNNLLCAGALQTIGVGGTAALLLSLAAPAAPSLSLLFVIAAVILEIILIGQMAFRLAFVALLGALAPIGLLCFALPQTLSWGRLWLQQFSLAVFVQFVQVAALCLGGALLAALATPTAALFVGIADGAVIVQALLLIILFYLALRLPGMLQAYGLRRIADEVSHATIETVEGTSAAAGELIMALAAA